jgi:uncharacterized phage protein (TIGR01671 family)
MELKFKAWDNEREQFRFFDFADFDDIRDVVFGDMSIFQFTGLKDKNGKELYFNSDIVKLDFYEGTRFEVVENIDIFSVAKYDRNRGLFYFDIFKPILHPEDSDRYIEFYYFINKKGPNNFEIIGTIQENPELMEVYDV